MAVLSLKRINPGGLLGSSHEFVMPGGCRRKRWPTGSNPGLRMSRKDVLTSALPG